MDCVVIPLNLITPGLKFYPPALLPIHVLTTEPLLVAHEYCNNLDIIAFRNFPEITKKNFVLSLMDSLNHRYEITHDNFLLDFGSKDNTTNCSPYKFDPIKREILSMNMHSLRFLTDTTVNYEIGKFYAMNCHLVSRDKVFGSVEDYNAFHVNRICQTTRYLCDKFLT